MTAVITDPVDLTPPDELPPSGDPRWVRPAVALMLVGTGFGYLWNLAAPGYANAFYSAAVQAGNCYFFFVPFLPFFLPFLSFLLFLAMPLTSPSGSSGQRNVDRASTYH